MFFSRQIPSCSVETQKLVRLLEKHSTILLNNLVYRIMVERRSLQEQDEQLMLLEKSLIPVDRNTEDCLVSLQKMSA